MKVDENIKLKREQIEINIIELFKYICTKITEILVFSVVIAVVVLLVMFFNNRDDSENNYSESENVIELDEKTLREEKMENAREKLAFYEKTYERELEYKDKSIYINLNYKNVYVATFQYNIKADEKHLLDVMTAFSNYGNDGGMVTDIYELDNGIESIYLKELIKVTCSTYSSYDTSSVMTVRIYTNSEENSKKYADIIAKVLDSYSDSLNQAGMTNELNKIYEKFFIGQDVAIWNAQKTYNATITELENNIASVENRIAELEEQTAMEEEDNSETWSWKTIIKYAILGLVAGIVVAIVLLIIKYVVSDKIKYDTELNEAAGIPCIGTLAADNKSYGENITSNLIFRDKYKEIKEKRLYYKLKCVCVSDKMSKVTIIGNDEACREDKLSNIGELVKDISIRVLGDVVNSIEAMEKLETGENVIIAVRLYKTSYGYIEELLKLCSVKDINILGYIFFD